MAKFIESKRNILCVGLCCLDIVVKCENFPDEDSDQRCLSHEWRRGGNAANTCTVLSHLGQECEYLGTLAVDFSGQFLKKDFEKHGICLDHCTFHELDSPVTTAIINQATGSRTLLHSNRNLPEYSSDEFSKLDLSKYDWIHFEGRNVQEVLRMIELVNVYNDKNSASDKIYLSVEIEKPRTEMLQLLNAKVDIVIVGKDFMKWFCDEESISNEIPKDIFQISENRYLFVMPWGEEGVYAFDKTTGMFYKQSAFKESTRNIVDSLGAGDTFLAALIFKFLKLCNTKSSSINESSIKSALEFACYVASKKCYMDGFSGLANLNFDGLYESS